MKAKSNLNTTDLDDDDDEEAKDRPLMLSKPTVHDNPEAYLTAAATTTSVAH